MAVDDLWHLSRPPEGAKPCGEHGKLVASDRHGRGKRWRVRYTDPDGNPKTEAFDRKDDAVAFDVKMRSDVQRGEYHNPDAGKTRFRDYADSWLKARTIAATSREAIEGRFRNHVYPVLGGRELRELARRPTLIREWHNGLSKSLSRSTVQAIYKNVSSVLSAAVDDGEISKNPCRLKTLKPPKPVDRPKVIPWEPEKVSSVRSGVRPRYQATVDCGAGAGLRQGEVFGLAVDDVDFLRHNIRVCRQVILVRGRPVFALPKFETIRDVVLSDALALRLAAHLQQFPAVPVTLPWGDLDGPPVKARLIFTTRNGTAINRNFFNDDVWRPALTAAGVTPAPDQGFHQLRHYWASVMLADGVDIKALSEYLGHKDPAFTLRTYTHLMRSTKDRARAAADSALPPVVPSVYRAAL